MNNLKFRAFLLEAECMLNVAYISFSPVLEIYCGDTVNGEEILLTNDYANLPDGVLIKSEQ